VTDAKTNRISILPGDGAGRFGQPTVFSTINGPGFIAAGDFNKDGKPDLAVIGQFYYAQLVILLGDGKGGFAAAQTSAAKQGMDYCYGIALGDFNGDGNLDVALAYRNAVIIEFCNGAGGFTSWRRYDLGINSAASGIAAADFNKDGKMDMAVSIISLNKVFIMRGDGLGGFTIPLKLTVGQNPQQVIVSDLNADNKADLVVPNSGTHDVSVLLGAAPGNFSPPQNYSLGGTTLAPKSAAVGDFNGDKRLDLAVPMASYIATLTNTCQ
jgi:hypothetical protein